LLTTQLLQLLVDRLLSNQGVLDLGNCELLINGDHLQVLKGRQSRLGITADQIGLLVDC